MRRVTAFAIATALSVVGAGAAAMTPSDAVAQAQDGRSLSPADVRELRREARTAQAQRDAARGAARAANQRTAVERANLQRVAEIFGLDKSTPPDQLAKALLNWVEEDEANRRELERLNDVIAGLQSGQVKDAAAEAMRGAVEAFNEGRVGDAERILDQLVSLRSSGLADGWRLWRESVLLRASLARQQLQFERAKEITRDAAATSNEMAEREVRRDQFAFAFSEAETELQEGNLFGKRGSVERAVDLFTQALTFIDRAADREDWSRTQRVLGYATFSLAGINIEPDRYWAALSAYDEAIATMDRDTADWASTVAGRAAANGQIALNESSREHYLDALEGYATARTVFERSGGLVAVADILLQQAQLKSSAGALDESIQDINDSLAIILAQPESALGEWRVGLTYIVRGNLYFERGRIFTENGMAAMPATYAEDMQAARESYALAIDNLDPARLPAIWAEAHYSLGNTLSETGRLDEAIEHFERALGAIDRQGNPIFWARIQFNVGVSHLRLGRPADRHHLVAAERALQAALDVFTAEQLGTSSDRATRALGDARALLADLGR